MAQRICSRCGGADCECNAPMYKEHYIPIKCKDCDKWYEIDKLGAMRMSCPWCMMDRESVSHTFAKEE